MAKRSKNDFNIGELNLMGISVFDYGKAGELCMSFLDENKVKLSKHFKQDVCTQILDNQRKNERFSETASRLKLIKWK